MLADFHRARPYMTGDYYPLTTQTLARTQWQVLQFDRPDLAGGCVVALRRTGSPFNRAKFPLRGVIPDARYEVEDADGGAPRLFSGRELLETGLEIDLPERRSGALFFYRKTQAVQ